MEPLADDDPPSIGRYRLLGRLGAGGMGRVYLGRTEARSVAVKVMHGAVVGEPGFRRRFAREVELARRVSGPHTASVLDADLGTAAPWLVTEYVPGPTLSRTVQRHGPLTVEATLALAAGLAEALRSIHLVGVVHRDLKPGNIILSEEGPRVIDFGIAKALRGSSEISLTPLTPLGGRFGTPPYMSPEQMLGEELGPASDVFSLGSVLYYAATGAPPFGRKGLAVIQRVLEAAPDLSALPEDLRDLVGSCLAREPANRPDPDRLLAELGARPGGEEDTPPVIPPAPLPPTSGPPTPGPPTSGPPSPPPTALSVPERGRRRRLGAALVGALVLLSAGVYVLGTDRGDAPPTAEAGPDEEETVPPAASSGDAVPVEEDDGPDVEDLPAPEAPEDPCRPEDVLVTLDFSERDREVYSGGSHPGFRVVVVNTAAQTCTVDTGPGAIELLVHSGDDRVYSSADCVGGTGEEERQLLRGVPHEYTLTWDLGRSSVDCADVGAPAGPGWYRANLVGDYASGADQLVFQLTG
ncbi:serine/threonine-protein kinase [Nocardiopsis sp. NPDC006938]|uniref:serine/threonine-protein kinase n=1 Tax=Nocardiopsis sp. NPDC006938 TaxID=3364337 RepID=UPI0036918D7D